MSAGPASSIDLRLLQSTAFEAILCNAPAAIVVVDARTALLFANAEAQRVLGSHLRTLDSPQWPAACGYFLPDRETLYPTEQLPMRRALAGEPVQNALAFLRNADHPEGLWLRVSSRPMLDEEAHLQGAIVVYHDITAARKDAEVTRLLSRAVEQTDDTVVITSRTGKIEYVNRAFEITTGYTRAEALGSTPRLLKSGMHDTAFYRALWAQILSGESFCGTIVNRKKSGQLYWAEQTITPIRNDQDQITHFVSVLKDVTELRKRQEHEFQLQLARDLQQRFYSPVVSVPGLDIGISAQMAAEVGGDYVDIIAVSPDSVFFLIGDATGHGISAAILISLARAYARAFVLAGMDTAQVLTRVNQMLVDDLSKMFHAENSWFVTLLLVHLDLAKRTLTYANAGHVAGILLSPAGAVDHVLASTGIPLGLFRDSQFASDCTRFEPAHLLLLMSDGASDATNAAGAACGSRRLVDYAMAHAQQPAQRIADGIAGVVRDFAGNRAADDDLSVVLIRAE